MNLGALAGGIAKGWSQGQEDRLKAEEAKRREAESARQDEERKLFDDIVKQVGEADKKRRAIAAPVDPSPAQAAVMESGVTPRQPQGDQTAPAAPVADVVAATSTNNSQQRYRDHTPDDRFSMVDDMYGRLLNAGLFDKAAEIGQVRTAMMGEKLQNETKQRETAARGLITALESGDDGAILRASKAMSGLIPDGKEPRSIKSLPDGRLEVVYGDDGAQPMIVTRDQLKQSAVALVDWKAVLDYEHRNQQMELNRKKEERDAKHQEETLKIDREKLSLDRWKAKNSGSGEGSTAEIKNVNFLIKNGIAKNPADAWEMVRTGKTPAGEQVVSDGMGGVMIYNRDSGQVSKIDGRGKETVVRQPGGAQPAATGNPAQTEQPPIAGARKAPDGNWYVQKDGKWHLVN